MTKAFHKMTHYFVYQKGSLHKIENNNIPNKCKKGKIKYVLYDFSMEALVSYFSSSICLK